jgi:DNA primase
MRVDRETGKFNCFSCGFHGNVFLHFGEYQSRVNDAVYKTRTRMRDIQLDARGLEIPASALAFNKDFRGISGKTLEHFGAFLHGEDEFENRIVFPISDVTGKIRCFNARHKFSNAKPKYKMYPEGADIPLFPFVKGFDHIILVEGLFDMLNLQDKGIPNAVCTFGTQNLTYNNVKEKLLPYEIAGVNKVLILMDRDKAGMYAAKVLLDTIKIKTRCEVVNITEFLDVGQDPGELSEPEVRQLSKRIKKLFAR